MSPRCQRTGGGALHYDDFVLHLSLAPGGAYTVHVPASPEGNAHARVAPLDPWELRALRSGARDAVTRHSGRASSSAANLTPRAIGERLFRLVFVDDVARLFYKSLGRAAAEGKGLRLQLRIEVPELAHLQSLPWELLYDGMDHEFLCLLERTQVARYLEVPRSERVLPIADAALPLHILAVVSDLAGPEHPPLDLERECRNLVEATRPLGAHLEILRGADRQSLADALLAQPFHIVHFAGHGWFDSRTGEGGLCFKAPDGLVERVSGRTLALELERHVGLVVLNACHTARTADDTALDTFAGVATALVLGGMPAVVAMRTAISDRAAIAFSRYFYRVLAAGASVESATREGRLAIHRLPEPAGSEWSTPVLFLRTHDNGDGLVRHKSLATADPSGSGDEGAIWKQDQGALLTRAGARVLLDRLAPRLHRALTRCGLLAEPPELSTLLAHMQDLEARIEQSLGEKMYLSLAAGALPDHGLGDNRPFTPFARPIHAVIRQVLGNGDGDASSAQIAAAANHTRPVRNLARTLLSSIDPVVLLGDPGSGKTVSLQEAALTLLHRESRRIFPNLVLFVRLGEFHVTEGEAVDAAAVFDYVKRCCPSSIRPWIDDLDRRGRLIVLFDGMDEMSRERFNEHTEALSLFAATRRRRVKTLFSCRIDDFTGSFLHRRLVLLPFDRAQIARYLRGCLPAAGIAIEGRTWTPSQLARRLFTGALPVDARNPFVLWLLCLYLTRSGAWPDSRLDLIAAFQEENYTRKAKEAEAQGFELLPRHDALRAWARVAYLITERNQGSAAPLEALLEGLSPVEVRQAHDAIRTGRWCGVLAESLPEQPGQVRFEHHRFQEYFTAFWIHQQSLAIDWLAKLDAPRWQETMLNLVLAGGADDGVKALAASIEAAAEERKADLAAGARAAETKHRRAPKTLAQTGVPYRQEAMLADRVELGARMIHGLAIGSREREALWPAIHSALTLLIQCGRPVTQIKMIRACQRLDDVDPLSVFDQLLDSPIRWVSDQALILVSGGRDGRGLGQMDLASAMGLDLAVGRFLPRWPIFARAVAGTGAARVRTCFLWTTVFALLDLGLLLAATGFLYERCWAIVHSFLPSSAAPYLASLALKPPTTLPAIPCMVTVVTTLVMLHRQPTRAWAFVLGSAPAGLIVVLAAEAMQHGEWTIAGVVLTSHFPLYFIAAPLFTLFAAPPRLILVALYSTITRRFQAQRITTATLLRSAWRDFRQALGENLIFLRETGSQWEVMYPILPAIVALIFAVSVEPALGTGILGITTMAIVSVSLFYPVLMFEVWLIEKPPAGSVHRKTLKHIADLMVAGFGGAAILGLIKVLMYLHRYAANIILGTAAVVGLFFAVRELSWAVRLAWAFRRPFPPNSFTPLAWAEKLAAADPKSQDWQLRATVPVSVGLDPAGYLRILEIVEPNIRQEPALSTYWERRDKIEQALRQERHG